MPIVPAAPPESTINAAALFAGSLPTDPGLHFLGGVPRVDLALTAPHRVFALPFTAIRRRRLAQADFVGWQFLLTDRGRVIASVEVLDDEDQPTAVTAGPFPAATATAIDRLETVPEIQAGDYELRILRINALYLVAAWAAAEKQLLLPLSPAPTFLNSRHLYAEPDFFTALNKAKVRPFTADP